MHRKGKAKAAVKDKEASESVSSEPSEKTCEETSESNSSDERDSVKAVVAEEPSKKRRKH
jgi:prolyl-tRNA editing enzyme YbaK/EbsC (Cys-tRNA(Pro) deacylase)